MPGSVLVMGLRAVQFGNDWIKKILRTAKLDEVGRRAQFSCQRNFLTQFPVKIGHCESSYHCLIFLKLSNIRANLKSLKPFKSILNWTVLKNK